jgi:hypothetical protein
MWKRVRTRSVRRLGLLLCLASIVAVGFPGPGQAMGLVSATDTRVDFGSVLLNSYTSGTPIIVSAVSGNVSIGSPSALPKNPPFILTQDSCTGSTIGPGPTGYACTITVDFSAYEPQITPGHYRSKLVLYDSNGHRLLAITFTGIVLRP